MTRTPLSLIAGALVLVCAAAPAYAQESAATWMRGLDELVNLEVISVSKKEQRLGDTAAAVFVLTYEDIRRSGMTTVPDLLRLVPGVHVAQIDGNKWAVTVRGFNSRWANKLLVMVNGRSIYTSLFSGVFWDALEMPVDEIERIEIIRGPGVSIWGANAVNGIVNIITLGPSSERETTVAGGAGSVDNGFAVMRHTGMLGGRVNYRLFGEFGDRQSLTTNDGNPAYDGMMRRSGGIAVHAALSASDSLAVDLTVLNHHTGSRVNTATSLAPFTRATLDRVTENGGWAITTRWTRDLDRKGRLRVEGSIERLERTDSSLAHNRVVSDVAVEHRVGERGRHDLGWGVSYRRTDDTTRGSLGVIVTPEQFADDVVSAFVQDEFRLHSRVRLIAGTKVEHHDFTGWAVQPSLRFHWNVANQQTIWAAASHAVHAPSRLDRGIRINVAGFSRPGAPPTVVAVMGNPEYEDERLEAYELGYRFPLGASASVDVATYYNRYDGLQTVEPRTPFLETAPGLPHLVVPRMFDNLLEATTAGVESSITFEPRPWWKLSGSYTLFAIDARPDARSLDPDASLEDGLAPRHQGQIRSSLSIGRSIDVDSTLFLVDRLRRLHVPAYARFDTRIAWRPVNRLELSAALQNLFDAAHVEFEDASSGVAASRLPRSATARIAWRF